MSEHAVAAVMIHVGSVPDALAWYQRAFPQAMRERIADPEFECLSLGNVRLELVPADAKVSSGASGSVVYWQVANLESSLKHFEAIGARLYRGPMSIEGASYVPSPRSVG